MTLRGRTVLAGGAPVSAQVRVATIRPDPDSGMITLHDEAATSSSSDRLFEIRLTAAPNLCLTASVPGFRSDLIRLTDSTRPEEVLKQGRRFEFDRTVVLREMVSVRGRVLRPDQSPAAGARVSAFLKALIDQIALPETETVAGDDGTFHLESVTPGQLLLLACLPGFAPARAEAAAPGDTVIMTLSPSSSVSGRAVDARTSRPICGALLSLRHSDTVSLPGNRSQVRTQSGGEFSLHDLRAGTYVVDLTQQALGYRPLPGSDSIQIAEGETKTGLELQFDPGFTIRGTVVDVDSSHPLAEVKYRRAPYGDYTQTTASGEFRVGGVFEKLYDFSGERSGYDIIADSGRVDLTSATDSEVSITVLMRRQPRIPGRVLMKAGGPAAGATVRISGSASRAESECLTDSQGRYEIPATAHSKVRLQAFLSGMAPASTGEIMVPREGEAFPDLILSPGKTVTGRVTDETSTPLPGARVRIYTGGATEMSHDDFELQPQPDSEGRPSEAVTDADGVFRFRHVPSGHYTLHAEATGHESGTALVEVPEEGPVPHTEIALSGLRMIAGRVLDVETSNPVAGARLRAMRGDTTTDLQGRFFMELSPGKKVTFVVLHPDYTSFREERIVEADKEIVLVLKPQHSFELIGNVLDAATRQPVEDFTVETRHLHAQFTAPQVERPGPGRFRVAGLSAGSIGGEIVVRADGYGLTSRHLMFASPRPGQRQVHETFLMHRLVRVRGRVVRASDRSGVPDVAVSIQAGSSWTKATDPVITDSDGRFTVEAPGARGGYVTVVVSRASESRPLLTRRLAVPDVPEPDLGDIEIGHAINIQGRVVRGESGTPVADEPVIIRPDFGNWRQETRTNAGGRFQFRDVPFDAQSFSFTLELPARSINRRLNRQNWIEGTEVVFRLGSVTLRGRVLHKGMPIDCLITMSPEEVPGGIELTTKTDGQGAFVLEGMLPGRWRVFIMPPARSSHGAWQHIEIPDREEVEHVFHLPTGRIHGTVYAPDGTPTPDVAVIATLTNRENSLRFTASNSRGFYSLDNLSSGEYLISASNDNYGHVSARLTLEEGEEKNIDLRFPEETATLISDAFSYPTGAPLVMARLIVRTPDGGLIFNGNVRDNNGLLTLEKLPPDTYHVTVSEAGYRSVQHTVTLEPGETRVLSDVLEPAGGLSWFLVWGDGTPVADLPVRLIPVDPSSLQEPRSDRTDRSGIWSLEDILPGHYRLQAGPAPDGQSNTPLAEEQVEIRPGEMARVKSEVR